MNKGPVKFFKYQKKHFLWRYVMKELK